MWWPALIGVPAATLAIVGLLGALARLIVLAVRRDHSTEALRLANEVRDQYAALAEAHTARIDEQQKTNIDIDRRLTEITTEKAALEVRIAELQTHITDQDATVFTQSDKIANLETDLALQRGRMARMEAERTELRARVARLENERANLLTLLLAHGISVPPELQGGK